MTKQEAFNKFLENNNLTAKIVPAHWPYDYNDNKAYVVTHNNSTQYFFFNDEGQLIQRKVLTDNE